MHDIRNHDSDDGDAVVGGAPVQKKPNRMERGQYLDPIVEKFGDNVDFHRYYIRGVRIGECNGTPCIMV